ncbi:MAG: DUF2075 domain-containing protein [Proteobacteria bacterium]|nr:DUF2075 domain-containing protein [Pseudomonadota bacterium]
MVDNENLATIPSPNFCKMSEEQKIIFYHIKNKTNVITNACAGSGKSTTVLSIASELQNEQILQITYNTMLSKEIKEKINNLQIENMTVFTYHAIAVKYYSRNAYTDTELIDIIQKNKPPITEIPNFTIFVIDEAQDMTRLYYTFIRKFLRDAKNKITLLILGDTRQCLYQFKGADSRFLTHAKILWENETFLNNKNFEYCKLNTSYRITKPMAFFVNDVLLGKEKTISTKDGHPILFIRKNNNIIPDIIFAEIRRLMEKKNHKPNDFFILCPSLKSSTVKKIENLLVCNNIPCYFPNNDGDKMDERVIDHKVIFSTFHAVKGRQRKTVFVLCFDESYFQYYAKNLPKNKCPNTIYVASTRATDTLYIIENDGNNTMPFLKKTHIQLQKIPEYIKFYGSPRIRLNQENDACVKSKEFHILPSEVVRFLSDSFLEKILPKLQEIFICVSSELTYPPPIEIDLPTIIETTNNQCEDISEINGIAIPTLFYDWIKSNNGTEKPPMENAFKKSHLLYSLIQNGIENIQKNSILYNFLHSKFKKIEQDDNQTTDNTIDKTTNNTIDETATNQILANYLYLSNFYLAISNDIYYKLHQIPRKNYNWLSVNVLQQCFDRLYPHFKDDIPNLQSEIIICNNSDKQINQKLDEHFAKKQFFANKKFRFHARVDFITSTAIWEIKCTHLLSYEHFIQIVIYAFLWNISHEKPMQYYLFNVRTGEHYMINQNNPNTKNIICEIVDELLEYKYCHNPETLYKMQNDFLFGGET